MASLFEPHTQVYIWSPKEFKSLWKDYGFSTGGF